MSKRQLSLAICDRDTYIDDVIAQRLSPDLEAIYAMAGALRVDVADLLRPGPQIGVSGGSRQNYWVEKTAEEYLASALSKSRDAGQHEAPSFDAILNWWHWKCVKVSSRLKVRATTALSLLTRTP